MLCQGPSIRAYPSVTKKAWSGQLMTCLKITLMPLVVDSPGRVINDLSGSQIQLQHYLFFPPNSLFFILFCSLNPEIV